MSLQGQFKGKPKAPKLKVIVRNLPNGITEDVFLKFEPVAEVFAQQKADWYYFVKGQYNQPAVAYLHFTNSDDLYDFYDNMIKYIQTNGSSTSSLRSIQIEYAPNQRISSNSKGEADPRQGTIEKDEEYLNFLKQMEKPVEKMLAADKQLEMQEDQERESGPKEAKTTPLLEALKEKRSKERAVKQAQQPAQQQGSGGRGGRGGYRGGRYRKNRGGRGNKWS